MHVGRTRRLIDLETHHKVFGWVLRMLADEGLLKGNTIAIDGTTLEANAALRSIVRRDNGEAYNEFLEGLARESGIETPTREQLAKFDRKRPKKGSNDDWQNPHDPDARITKMKDGHTHLATRPNMRWIWNRAWSWRSRCSQRPMALPGRYAKRFARQARTSVKRLEAPVKKR